MLYQQYAAGEPVHDTSITLPANGSEPLYEQVYKVIVSPTKGNSI